MKIFSLLEMHNCKLLHPMIVFMDSFFATDPMAVLKSIILTSKIAESPSAPLPLLSFKSVGPAGELNESL